MSKANDLIEKLMKGGSPSSLIEDYGNEVATPIEEPNPVAVLAGQLFHSRTLAHLAHLATPNFASHEALGYYYDAILGYADAIVEQEQSYGNVLEIIVPPVNLKEPPSIIDYFENLRMTTVDMKGSIGDVAIQNLIDEVVGVINKLLYKLKVLS